MSEGRPKSKKRRRFTLSKFYWPQVDECSNAAAASPKQQLRQSLSLRAAREKSHKFFITAVKWYSKNGRLPFLYTSTLLKRLTLIFFLLTFFVFAFLWSNMVVGWQGRKCTSCTIRPRSMFSGCWHFSVFLRRERDEIKYAEPVKVIWLPEIVVEMAKKKEKEEIHSRCFVCEASFNNKFALFVNFVKCVS